MIIFLKDVTGIGIVTNYLENNTLQIMKGTSTIYEIEIQNTEEEMKVKLVLQSDIAKVIDYQEEYTLPKGVSNTPIYFNITTPNNARVGDEYTINYYVQPLSAKGGNIQFAIALNKNFKVKIIEDPNKPIPKVHFYQFIIAFFLLVLFIVLYKNYKNIFK